MRSLTFASVIEPVASLRSCPSARLPAQLDFTSTATLLALALMATRLPSIFGLRLSLRLQRLAALLQQVQLLSKHSRYFENVVS